MAWNGREIKQKVSFFMKIEKSGEFYVLQKNFSDGIKVGLPDVPYILPRIG